MTPRSSDADRPTAVVLDFDGTASVRDVGTSLLDRFAKDDSWRVIDNDFENGRIGSRTAYRIVGALLEGNEEEWTRFALETGRLDPGLATLAARVGDRGWRLEILSDGLGFYIRALLARGRLDLPVRANEVRPAGPEGRRGAPTIATPFLNPLCGRCGTCKSERVEALIRAGVRVVYVGDGYSDLCAAPRAHRLFAKSALAHHCRARQIPFEGFENLADVAAALAQDQTS